MPIYEYSAVDDLGKVLRGEAEASSEATLESLLRKQGRWLTQARERTVTMRSAAKVAKGNLSAPRRVQIEFFLQLGLQLGAGIPLVSALEFGIDEERHAAFKAVRRDVLDRVSAGSTFSDALAVHPRVFAPLVVSLIRAGESSGRLAEMCAEVRRHYEWLDRLAGDVRQALLYPSMVLSAAVLFFFLMFTFLIPRLAQVLRELKVTLPWLTSTMLDLSDFMKGNVGSIIAVVVLTALALKFVPKFSPKFALMLDIAKLRVPVFGPVNRLICLSRVGQNLSTLYRAGIPLLSALQFTRTLAGNLAVSDALKIVEANVNAGRAMNEAMRESDIFSPLMIRMVAVGETTGTLGQSLQHVADYYNEVVPRRVKALLAMIEPVLIVGLIVLVGTVAMAVFLPIVSLMDAK